MRSLGVALLAWTLVAMASLTLAGCFNVLLGVGTAITTANAVYQNVGLVTGTLDKAVTDACQGFRERHALATGRIEAGGVDATQAARVGDIAAYAIAACDPNNPPPAGDPLQTAIWLAELGGKVDALTAQK